MPPTFKFSAIPTPPETISAPELTEVEAADDDTVKFPTIAEVNVF